MEGHDLIMKPPKLPSSPIKGTLRDEGGGELRKKVHSVRIWEEDDGYGEVVTVTAFCTSFKELFNKRS